MYKEIQEQHISRLESIADNLRVLQHYSDADMIQNIVHCLRTIRNSNISANNCLDNCEYRLNHVCLLGCNHCTRRAIDMYRPKQKNSTSTTTTGEKHA